MLDQLPLAVGRQGRDNFLIVQDSCGNQGLLPAIAVQAKCVEIRQVRERIDEPALPEPAPTERDRDHNQHEQPWSDVEENQLGFERNRGTEQYRRGGRENEIAMR